MSEQDDELTPQDWDELIEAAYIDRIPSAAIRNKVVEMQKIVERFSPTLADWKRHGKLAQELAWLVPTLLDENAQLRAERDRLLARCEALQSDKHEVIAALNRAISKHQVTLQELAIEQALRQGFQASPGQSTCKQAHDGDLGTNEPRNG